MVIMKLFWFCIAGIKGVSCLLEKPVDELRKNEVE